MNLLLCSDGSVEAENAVRYVSHIAGAIHGKVTLFGVAEKNLPRSALESALIKSRQMLQELSGVRAETLIHEGDPTEQILARSFIGKYDLVIIAARRKEGSPLYWRSQKSYEIIKSIEPPVLVVVGRSSELKRILICAGGKQFIDPAVELTARLAMPTGAHVTLLHVISQSESYRTSPEEMESDAKQVLDADNDLSKNLKSERDRLETLGISTQVRIRRGNILNELATELHENEYDLVVTGTTPSRGRLQRYVLGDLTREIVNRVGCPILVVRSDLTVKTKPSPLTPKITKRIANWLGVGGSKKPMQ